MVLGLGLFVLLIVSIPLLIVMLNAFFVANKVEVGDAKVF